MNPMQPKLTRPHRWLICLFIAFASTAHAQDPTGVIRRHTRDDVFDSARLGVIHALVPTVNIDSLVIFADGDGGWNDGVKDMAQLLANEGALVLGVDTPQYLKSLDSADKKDSQQCASPAEDFIDLVDAADVRYALKRRPPPILIGYSSGATLVYAVLAQAAKHAFRGAITLGFCSTLEIRRPLCTGRALAFHHTAEGLDLFPTRQLGAQWFVLQGTIDQACSLKEISNFAGSIPSAKVIPLSKVGHGFAVARRWQPQYVAAFRSLQSSSSK